MPIWETEPVSRQPTLTLKPWQVKQLRDGDRHLVGYRRENGDGRVSSAILRFDPANRLVETQTGRVYRLEGSPAAHMDAEYVWHAWLQVHELTNGRDVSNEVYAAIKAAQEDGGRGS